MNNQENFLIIILIVIVYVYFSTNKEHFLVPLVSKSTKKITTCDNQLYQMDMMVDYICPEECNYKLRYQGGKFKCASPTVLNECNKNYVKKMMDEAYVCPTKCPKERRDKPNTIKCVA